MAEELTKHQKYYRNNREKAKQKSKEYYQKNRDRIIKWKAEYRKNNKEKLKKDKLERREKHREYWHENGIKNIYNKAEDIIIKKVLKKLGFSDIFRPTTNFYFDGLAKKGNGKIYAIEVTTHERKQLGKHRIKYAKYFKMPIWIFFVKPDLSCYYLIKMKYPDYIRNPEYYYGTKKKLEK